MEPQCDSRGTSQNDTCAAITGEKVAGNVNLELVAAACWEGKEDVGMVENGNCSTGVRGRKGRERKKPGIVGVMEAEEEGVSRRKGWSIEV